MSYHKNIRNIKPFSILIRCFLCGLLTITLFDQKEAGAKIFPLSITDQGLLSIQTDNLELKHIISAFKDQKSIKFTGFSDLMDKKITLSYTGSTTDVINKILKFLEIQNYAYTFNGEEIIHVTALTAPANAVANKNSLPQVTEFTKNQNGKQLNSPTVQIQKVLPDSQGEYIQLEATDYIIAYNGHRIQNTGELIDYVKKYDTEYYINLVVVRDERIMQFTLQGGMIGVQVTTVPINSEVLETYYKDLGI